MSEEEKHYDYDYGLTILLAFGLGLFLGYIIARNRAKSVIFDRDAEGRITGIHYV